MRQQSRTQDEVDQELDRFSEIYAELTKPFPVEALSKDSSRGFDLTSVKAQYVVERLNDVLINNKRGGWEFVPALYGGEKAGFQEVPGGILYHGKLVINDGHRGCAQTAVGFSAIKDGKNIGDAYKGAMTDALSKAASKFGVANDVFKGLVTPPGRKSNTKASGSKKLTKVDF